MKLPVGTRVVLTQDIEDRHGGWKGVVARKGDHGVIIDQVKSANWPKVRLDNGVYVIIDMEAGEAVRANPAKRNPAKRFGKSTNVETLLFAKDQFTPSAAQRWAESKGFRVSKIDEGGPRAKFFRIRQHPVDSYRPGTFRTISLTDGVEAVVGVPKQGAQRTRVVRGPRSRSNPDPWANYPLVSGTKVVRVEPGPYKSKVGEIGEVVEWGERFGMPDKYRVRWPGGGSLWVLKSEIARANPARARVKSSKPSKTRKAPERANPSFWPFKKKSAPYAVGDRVRFKASGTRHGERPVWGVVKKVQMGYISGDNCGVFVDWPKDYGPSGWERGDDVTKKAAVTGKYE